MRNKLLLVITILFTSCLFIQGVKADNETLTLNCDATIAPGGTATCKVVATTTDETVTGVRFTTSVSENLSIKSIDQDAMSCDYNVDTGITSCDTSSTVASGSSVATITVEGSSALAEGDTASVTISNGSVNSSDETLTDTKEFTVGSSSTVVTSDDTDSSNPKTMDANMAIIITIVLTGVALVVLGKNKLNKITR